MLYVAKIILKLVYYVPIITHDYVRQLREPSTALTNCTLDVCFG